MTKDPLHRDLDPSGMGRRAIADCRQDSADRTRCGADVLPRLNAMRILSSRRVAANSSL